MSLIETPGTQLSSEILGHFGPYGGRFVPEALIGALEELDRAHQAAMVDPDFPK